MKKILLLACISVVVVGGWRLRSKAHHDASSTSDGTLVVDRLWLDHMPRGERDEAKLFAAFSEESIGVFHTLTRWTGTYEGFRFEHQGDELRVVFPQNGDKEKLRAVARHCDEKGFDYCLEIKGSSRGVKRYYSMEGWDIGSLDDENRLAAKLAR
jgi:hypothetical protein